MTTKLWPCPFCNTALERSEVFSTRLRDHFVHPENDCFLGYRRIMLVVAKDGDAADDVERWNRRAPNPLRELVEDSVPIIEAVLDDREAINGEEDEILRDLLDRLRVATSTKGASDADK